MNTKKDLFNYYYIAIDKFDEPSEFVKANQYILNDFVDGKITFNQYASLMNALGIKGFAVSLGLYDEYYDAPNK